MYEDLINLVINIEDSRFADFPLSIDGEIYLEGNNSIGWTTIGKTVVQAIPTVETIEPAIQAHIDNVAKANGFDSINSIGKFVGYDNSKRVLAESLGAWCANVWDFAEVEQAKVVAGTRTLPATMEEVIAELPIYA